VRHAAFAWTGLRWLDGQPELRDRLATGARQALASERALVFELI
jgi:hypothetical protein